MLALQSIALLLASSTVAQTPATGETVLIQFTAPWCGPCKMMGPTVGRLVDSGYPVRRVNIDQDRELAARYNVTSIPCFVMVVGGQEVDREVGLTGLGRLERMLGKGRVRPPAKETAHTRAQSPDTAAPARPPNKPRATYPSRKQSGNLQPAVSRPVAAVARRLDRADIERRAPRPVTSEELIKSSVRLKIEDAKSHSFGTGTIIDVRGDEALVLTCAHIFRDVADSCRISVDLFCEGAGETIEGQLIAHDLKRDIGLVAIRPNVAIVAAHVAPKDYTVKTGARVTNIGCDNGRPPTARESRITAVDKYLGPPNIEVAGLPVEGRSGGGLFDEEGYLIGVCNAADPIDNEGVYAGLLSVHAELDRLGLSDIYRQAGAEPRSPSAWMASTAPPPMPREMPAADGSETASGQPRPAEPPRARDVESAAVAAGPRVSKERDPRRFSASEQAALDEIAARGQDSEVIVIIRPLRDPEAKSEILVLDQASPEFLKLLATRKRITDSRQLTSHDVETPAAATPAEAQWTEREWLDAAGWRGRRPDPEVARRP